MGGAEGRRGESHEQTEKQVPFAVVLLCVANPYSLIEANNLLTYLTYCTSNLPFGEIARLYSIEMDEAAYHGRVESDQNVYEPLCE